MKRCSLALSLAPVVLAAVTATSAGAQQTRSITSSSSPPCVSDWACGSFRPPLGFYIDSIIDDGRYVRLDDGTIWEVQSDFRAIVAGWTRDNFVEVRRVLAPTGDYEWLFVEGDDPNWRA